jgi:hypothetical protein
MKKALLVGINNYPSSPLRGCINDAAALKSILETHGNGDPNFAIRIETDVPTKSELKTMIAELFTGTSANCLKYACS